MLMDHEKLVRMVNQIGTFFQHEGEKTAPLSIQRHIIDFWDPRMRNAILEHFSAGGDGLNPLSRKAIELLHEQQQKLSV
jgi:formate dehydrogenase subunit delta